MIVFKSGMLVSKPRWIQPMFECRYYMTSQAFECSGQHLEQSGNIVPRFPSLTTVSHLLASEPGFLTNRVFSEGDTESICSAQLLEFREEDFEW
jgi:hypothetical protein